MGKGGREKGEKEGREEGRKEDQSKSVTKVITTLQPGLCLMTDLLRCGGTTQHIIYCKD